MAMAKSVVTVDDLDGSPNAQTVKFEWDGKHYEIDLSKKNVAAFEKVLAPYLEVARKTRRHRGERVVAAVRSARPRRSDAPDGREVRAWAVENGHQVSPRGRVSVERSGA